MRSNRYAIAIHCKSVVNKALLYNVSFESVIIGSNYSKASEYIPYAIYFDVSPLALINSFHDLVSPFPAICLCYGYTVAVDPVTLSSQNSTSLTVTWKRALYDENNTAAWYEITYEESDCSLANSASFSESNAAITVDELNATLVDNETLQYNLTGLNKWTGYIVAVTAFFSNGSKLGNRSTVECQTTLQDGTLL